MSRQRFKPWVLQEIARLDLRQALKKFVPTVDPAFVPVTEADPATKSYVDSALESVASTARVLRFKATDFHGGWSWTGSPTVAGQGTAYAYNYVQAAISATYATTGAVHCNMVLPDDWVPGSAITIDLGFGVSSCSTSVDQRIDVNFKLNAHSFNDEANVSDYRAREYSTSKSGTVTAADVLVYSQTFRRIQGITVTADGTLGGYDLSPGDVLHFEWYFTPSATNGCTASTAKSFWLQVHYEAGA